MYRFWSAAGLCEQRIVLDEFIYDIEELMSSICWIVCHGNSDDNKEHDLKVKKSLGDKLFLTCGASSLWIKRLLEEKHVKARVVTSLTEDEWNTYDNGHTLLEVFDSHLQRWIVVDVDMHCYFKKDGKILNFVEFWKAVRENRFEIISLSLSDKLDGSNFKTKQEHSYVFAMERFCCSEITLREWYQRVIQVPMIYDDKKKKYLFSFCKNKKKIESYCLDYQYSCPDEWFQLFYS